MPIANRMNVLLGNDPERPTGARMVWGCLPGAAPAAAAARLTPG